MPRHSIVRRLLSMLLILGLSQVSGAALAHHTDTHFEDESKHKIVYQCNRADNEYLTSVLFSVGELIRKYGDDVEVVVACFGPGIHLLAQIPERPISELLQQRVSSLAAYGVAFHACGNTMKSLNWDEKDLVEFAKVVPIGVGDIMQLPAKGFAYFAW